MSMKITASAIAVLMTLAVGCATTNGTQSAGAIAAGGLTGILCSILGGSPGVCIASGIAAGAAVWAGMEYTKRGETRDEIPPVVTDSATPPRPMIIIDQFDVTPKEIPPGGTFSATTQYRLLIPSNTEMRPVTQTFTLMKDGKVIREMPVMAGELKDHGRYEVAWDFTVPDKADLGTYELKQVLEAQTRAPERRQAIFAVVEKLASFTTAGG